MTNFSNYYCIVIFLHFIITKCKTDDINTNDLEIDDYSGLDVDLTGLNIEHHKDVCGLPIDEGDCGNESLGTNETNDNDSAIDEPHELEEPEELNKLNDLDELESNERTRYFGYNRNTMQCEQFNYDGCGGNGNRFETLNECKKTCYTSLKYFLSKVTELLMFRFNNETSELPPT